MEKQFESSANIDKQEDYLKEYQKLTDLFEKVDDSKKKLAAGLIEDAAYLYAESKYLRALLKNTGMVRINPNNLQQQKPIEAAKQYRANVDTYSSVISKLSKILDTQLTGDDDDLNEFE